MSEEGARASSDGDVGRAGWDWETKAVMDAIRAPGSIGTKNRDEATAVVKNDNKGSVARGSWLQVGDVENVRGLEWLVVGCRVWQVGGVILT